MGNRTNLRDQRLPQLEALLAVEGSISNSRLRELFGLERAQATRLVTAFLQSRPKKRALQRQDSRWLERTTTEPVETETLEAYLRLSDAPWFEDARIGVGSIDATVLQKLRTACCEGLGVEVNYLTLNSGQAGTRVIYPHTVVRVGRRLHARAWSPERKEYRDFVLSRIQRIALTHANAAKLPRDEEWHKYVEVEFAPHSGLPQGQKTIIEMEFSAGQFQRRMRMRVALLPYLLLELRAAVRPDQQQPPEYLLEVGNRTELKPYLFRADGG